jgi:hypothetical protein
VTKPGPLLLLFLALLLAGCGLNPNITLTPDQDKTFDEITTLLRERKFAELEKLADPELRGPNFAKECTKIADAFPGGEPISSRAVGQHLQTRLPFDGKPKTTNYVLSKEYEFPSGWMMLVVQYRMAGEEFTLLGLRIFELPASLEETNRFTLEGKGPLHFLVLGGVVVIPLFIITTVVICVRTPIRRKWLWILFILFGIGSFVLNWSTGEYSIQPLTFRLLGASGLQTPFGPWVFGISFPLGAILFLLKRRKLLKTPAAAPPLA